MFSTLLTACSDGGRDTEAQTEDVMETKAILSQYTVIFSESADIKIKTAATRFATALGEFTGTTVKAGDDYIGSSSPETTYEILVGDTNREQSSDVKKTLDSRDYTIRLVGEKIVINGGSGPAVLLALDEAKELLTTDRSAFLDESCAITVKNANVVDYYFVDYPAEVNRTAEQFSASITNDCGVTPVLLDSETVQLTEFDPNWSYTHHTRVGYFKGKVYAAWNTSPQDEDSVKGITYISYSSDFKNWSEPYQIAEMDPLGLYSPGFFYTHGDTLYFYYNYAKYETADKQGGVSENAYIYTTDGVNWSKPRPFGYYTGVTAPQASYGGRIFLCRGTAVLYTDDPTGETGWKKVELDTTAAKAAGARDLCEGNFYQTYDGVLHTVMRGDDGYLWHSESYNNGSSWTPIYKTSFTDDNAMAYFGKLPDGRIYYIGNPHFTGYSARATLALYISDEDGQRFDEQYILRMECDYSMERYGNAKSGYYGYPEAVIGDDGYIYVIYSKLKEVVEITRFKISDIGNTDAQTEIKYSENGKFLTFDSVANCGKVTPVNCYNMATKIKYDTDENALKISGGSSIELHRLFDGKLSTADYPVVAIRIKKENITAKYCGFVNWETDKTGKTKFGSFRYANDEEYHTMIIDLSEVSCYASSVKDSAKTDEAAQKIVDSFVGNWESLYIRLTGSQSDLNEDTAFYIKWVAFYPSVNDAITDLILEG